MPANEYYDSTGYPSNKAAGTAATMRSELDLIEAGFNKMPALTGNNNKLVGVNSGGSALEAKSASSVKTALGLDQVDNTSDADKPISTATQSALDLKATIEALNLKADISALNLKANIASPTFTGTPAAPTPANTDNSTKIATTAHVKATMPGSAGASGYQRFPNGILKQWGSFVTPPSSAYNYPAVAVSFPIQFTAVYGVQITDKSGNTSGGTYGWTSAISASGFTGHGGGNSTFYYEAIGYVTPA